MYFFVLYTVIKNTMAVGNKGWKVGKRGPKGLVGPRGPPGESAGSAGPNLVSSSVNITATEGAVNITGPSVNVVGGDDGCYVQANGGVIINSGTASIMVQPSGIIGLLCTSLTVNGQYLSNTPYVAGNAATWDGNPPVTIQEAIDRLANGLYAIGAAS